MAKHCPLYEKWVCKWALAQGISSPIPTLDMRRSPKMDGRHGTKGPKGWRFNAGCVKQQKVAHVHSGHAKSVSASQAASG